MKQTGATTNNYVEHAGEQQHHHAVAQAPVD